jgi:hypothetical protein
MRMLAARSVGAGLCASSWRSDCWPPARGVRRRPRPKTTSTTSGPARRPRRRRRACSAGVGVKAVGRLHPVRRFLVRARRGRGLQRCLRRRRPASLRGVPEVAGPGRRRTVDPDLPGAGGPAQAGHGRADSRRHPRAAGARAGSSITFSDVVACAAGSLSLTVRFPGWASVGHRRAEGRGPPRAPRRGTAPTTSTTVPAPCSDRRGRRMPGALHGPGGTAVTG